MLLGLLPMLRVPFACENENKAPPVKVFSCVVCVFMRTCGHTHYQTSFVSGNLGLQVLIHLDMFWALTNVSDDKIHVMVEQSSRALVTCVWSHSVWEVHTVELFTNVASVGSTPILSSGL